MGIVIENYKLYDCYTLVECVDVIVDSTIRLLFDTISVNCAICLHLSVSVGKMPSKLLKLQCLTFTGL